MTDRDAFIAAVLAEPLEDAPRLVFADWLDENKEPEYAEFIRVQMAIEKAGRCPGTFGAGSDNLRDQCPKCVLQRREAELLSVGSQPGRVQRPVPGVGGRFVAVPLRLRRVDHLHRRCLGAQRRRPDRGAPDQTRRYR